MKTYDLLVLGGGPGGYTAAIRAAQLGGQVCLVEQDKLGGTCTNRGCIPTKVLAASAHLIQSVRNAADLGVKLAAEPTLDFAQVATRREQVVSTLRDGIEKLLKANGVDRFSGVGKLTGPNKVLIEGSVPSEITATSIIIATGSTPATLSNIPVDKKSVVTSDEILSATQLPKRLVVIGGGVIGCEFASIYRAFGVDVTVIELMDRLLPTMDPVLSGVLARAFKKSQIKVWTQTAVQGVELTGSGPVRVHLPNDQVVECDQVLVCVGRKSATAGIGLELLGVNRQKERILADEHMFTGREGIYAIGDAVGKTWLAHVAAKEGEVAAACALGHKATMRYQAVPSVVFTEPELATVGLGPAEAKARGIDIEGGTFFYGASGKALCDGLAEGRVELLTEKGSGKILGGWIWGAQAGVLIAEMAIAVDQGMTGAQLSEVIHAHPTLPEMVMEAAADSAGKAIHRAPMKRSSNRKRSE